MAERFFALLRRLEWCATVQGDDDHCPICYASKHNPEMNLGTHEPGCELEAMLRELKRFCTF